MKTKIILGGLVLLIFSGNAQPPNSFPQNGNAGVGSNSPNDRFTIDATGAGGSSMNGLAVLAGTSGYAIAVHNNFNGKFAVWPDGGTSVGSTNYWLAKLNVSIGSTNGSPAFHIYNNSSNKLNFSVADDGATVIGENISSTSRLTVNGQTSPGLNIVTANNSGYAMAIHNSAINPAGIFAIWPDGRIAVGNTAGNSDLAKLNVNMNAAGRAIDVYDVSSNTVNFRVYNTGIVYARAIFVQTAAFPDYVFDKDYALPSLNEVKNFISLNHRLPNMPSATQVETEGANLGEIQRLTVEKVEELYLYLIQLKEDVEVLRKENAALRNK